MNRESFKSGFAPLGWVRSALGGGAEYRPQRLDLAEFRHDPLVNYVDQLACSPELNIPLAKAEQGDIFVIPGDRPHFAIATGQLVGSRHIFYRAYPKPERTAYVELTSESQAMRIARQTSIPIPHLEDTIPVNIPQTGEFLAGLPTEAELNQFRFHFSETMANIYHRWSVVQPIESVDEITFNHRTGELPCEYLYVTSQGIPIFLSDFHQKLATHLAYLVASGLLPNEKPLVTWVDKHPDDIFDRNRLRQLPKKKFLLKGIDKCVDQIDCGQAASFLMHTNLADIRSPGSLTPLTPPTIALTYNSFDYRQPFARPPHTQPQVLSFDLDQLPYFCESEYNKYVGDIVGLDCATSTSYFSWLSQAGMNAHNYDAVCAYTSPAYVHPLVAIEGFKYLVKLFESSEAISS